MPRRRAVAPARNLPRGRSRQRRSRGSSNRTKMSIAPEIANLERFPPYETIPSPPTKHVGANIKKIPKCKIFCDFSLNKLINQLVIFFIIIDKFYFNIFLFKNNYTFFKISRHGNTQFTIMNKI